MRRIKLEISKKHVHSFKTLYIDEELKFRNENRSKIENVEIVHPISYYHHSLLHEALPNFFSLLIRLNQDPQIGEKTDLALGPDRVAEAKAYAAKLFNGIDSSRQLAAPTENQFLPAVIPRISETQLEWIESRIDLASSSFETASRNHFQVKQEAAQRAIASDLELSFPYSKWEQEVQAALASHQTSEKLLGTQVVRSTTIIEQGLTDIYRSSGGRSRVSLAKTKDEHSISPTASIFALSARGYASEAKKLEKVLFLIERLS